MNPHLPRLLALLLAIALTAACGPDGQESSDSTKERESGGGTEQVTNTTVAEGEAKTSEGAASPIQSADISLADVCPSPLVIQTDWFPEAEHGGLYEMIGDDYTIDAGAKTVTGPLVANGSDTGIILELRSGGPAIGFQQPEAQMALDDGIHLGHTFTRSANNWNTTPLIQVMAPLEKNPQIMMWDPETYPEVKTIDDLSTAGVTFNVFSDEVLVLPVAEGRIDPGLVDPSYDGSPARFVAANGAIAQQGFASAEPYLYENEFEGWLRPVAFQLLHDAGYEEYTQTLGVRPDALEGLRPCLTSFIPMAQQAQVDYVTNPERANAVIIDAVDRFDGAWVYDTGMAEFSVEQQLDLGLVSNGNNGTLGDFDLERVQTFIDQMVATGEFSGIPDGFTAEDLVTNEFIDPSIGL